MKYLPPIQKNFNDVCGIPLDGGKIEVFLHGTTTPASLYSDADGTAFAPNPYKVNVLGDVTFFVDADTELDYFVYDDLGYLRASYSKVKVNPCENGGGSGPSVDVEWDDVKNKPSAFPPSSHRHDASEIGNLPEVPTKVSELDNDSGYITSEAIPSVPTKTSDLQNDSDFVVSKVINNIVKVTELPETPDANTLYLVVEEGV